MEQIDLKNLKNPSLLTNEEIAHLLPIIKTLKDWFKKIEDYSLSIALEGQKIEGYKVVEGRSISRYKDSNEVLKRLTELGYKTSMFLKPQELVGVTDFKRILKKDYAKFEDLIEKPKGKPTLVEESDKREEWHDDNSIKGELLASQKEDLINDLI